jgi:hypothetical protein
MYRLAAILLLSLVPALGAASCGSGAPACQPSFTPCGGNIVGTWSFATTCGMQNLTSTSCPGESFNLSPNVSATFTFNADGTFSENATVDETGTETIPLSCLGGTVTDCTKLDQSGTFSGLTFSVSNCSGTAAEGCTCTITETGTLSLTGTWTAAGTNLSLASNGGKPGTPIGYCVSGSALLIAENSANSAYAILTKQ